MNKNNNIPNHWTMKSLRDVCKELQSGKRPKGGVQGIESGIPSLGAEHLNHNGGFKFEKIKFVPKEFAEQMKKGIVRKSDIIVVKDGATTAKTSFVSNDFPFEFAVINEHVFIVRLTEDVIPKFAFYKLYSSQGQKEILLDFRGAAQGGISSKFIDRVTIPTPPLPEQQAIVSKIEELLSDLENGKQQLQTAQQQLRMYRQSLLKWAFEGKLTNKKVKEGELPKGWKWVKVSEISNVVRGGSPRPAGDPKYYDGTIPFLKVRDITKDSGTYLTTFEYTIKEAGLRKTRQIRPNTLLLSNSGATLGVPKICMIDTTMNDGIAAFLDLDERSNLYLYYFWLSKTKELRNINMGAAQPNLNTNIIKNYLVPYCSFEEQQLIVDELESKLTVCDNIEETISHSLQQAETLRQSILKKAFEGKLV